MNTSHTDFLFAEPSFLEGMGRLFDFGDNMTEYNVSPTTTIADHIAIYLDYAAVGNDIYNALGTSGPLKLGKARQK